MNSPSRTHSSYSLKWTVERMGQKETWYSEKVIDKIVDTVQNTINKRPHSDNTVLENILKIIKEADNGCN